MGYRYNYNDEGGVVPPGDREKLSADEVLGKGRQSFEDVKSFGRACEVLREDSYGSDLVLDTPFGRRKLVYADYTASGRALKCIEQFIQQQVLPRYSNTHSLTSSTARQTTFFRNEAREIIRQYLNATFEDAVIFTGNGATAGMNTLATLIVRGCLSIPAIPSLTKEGGMCQGGVLKGENQQWIREARFGTFECVACRYHMKTSSVLRMHLNSHTHQKRVEILTKRTGAAENQLNRRRVIVFLLDPSLHHSATLPFKDLVGSEQIDEDLQTWSAGKSTGNRLSHMCITVPFDENIGSLDLGGLSRQLQSLSHIRSLWERATRKGSEHPQPELMVVVILNAASNVTGIKLPMAEAAALCHKFQAYVVGDFAGVGGHDAIDINPRNKIDGWIDAAVLSPHKFLGGPDTPGLLVIKKALLAADVPACPGGGSVFFVSEQTHSYIFNCEEREEAGTPNSVACIRAGMCMRLANLLPSSLITARELEYADFLVNNLAKHKRIHLLGSLVIPTPFKGTVSASQAARAIKAYTDAHVCGVRKGVISFLIKYGNDGFQNCPEASSCAASATEDFGSADSKCTVKSYRNRSTRGGLYLHHNFVSAVLNDVFGIQTRPGCVCAGPLSQYLLGMDSKTVGAVEKCLHTSGAEVVRPGFTRVSINYSMSWDEIELISHAVCWVADFGWQLLPYYTFNVENAEWYQRLVKPKVFRKWLSEVKWGTAASGELTFSDKIVDSGGGEGGAASSAPSSFMRRDPRKIVGAVALPGFGAAADELKGKLALNRAGLRPVMKKKSEVAEVNSTSPFGTSNSELLSKFGEIAKKKTLGGAIKQADSIESDKGLVPDKPEPNILSDVSAVDLTASRSNEIKAVASPPRRALIGSGGSASASPQMVGGVQVISESMEQAADSKSSTTEAKKLEVEAPAEEERDTLDGVSSSYMSSAVPEDMTEMYESATKIVDALRSLGDKATESGLAERITRLKNTGLSPALPAECSNFLWFPLPGDAAYSMRLFDSKRPRGFEPEPKLATSAESSGYPIWIRKEGVNVSAIKRPSDSFFEVRLFEAKVSSYDMETLATKNPFRGVVDDSNTAELGVLNIGASDKDTANLIKTIGNFVDQAGRFGKCQEIGVERLTNEAIAVEIGEANCAADLNEGVIIRPTKDILLPIPRNIRRLVGKAMGDFEMLREGDKVLLGLSGGKDSLTLLHILRDVQQRAPVRFQLACATVDPMVAEYNPKPLVEYLDQLGITYHMLAHPIVELAKSKMQGDSICAFCSRMKRGLLYSCMREHGYTVLALGQHLDDLAESFLMSAFHNGSLNTMKAHYRVGVDADVRVCRPLVYVREKELAAFAKQNCLPVISDNCPACFSAPEERLRIKLLIAEQEYEFPNIVQSLLRSMKPLMAYESVEAQKAAKDAIATGVPIFAEGDNYKRVTTPSDTTRTVTEHGGSGAQEGGQGFVTRLLSSVSSNASLLDTSFPLLPGDVEAESLDGKLAKIEVPTSANVQDELAELILSACGPNSCPWTKVADRGEIAAPPP